MPQYDNFCHTRDSINPIPEITFAFEATVMTSVVPPVWKSKCRTRRLRELAVDYELHSSNLIHLSQFGPCLLDSLSGTRKDVTAVSRLCSRWHWLRLCHRMPG